MSTRKKIFLKQDEEYIEEILPDYKLILCNISLSST